MSSTSGELTADVAYSTACEPSQSRYFSPQTQPTTRRANRVSLAISVHRQTEPTTRRANRVSLAISVHRQTEPPTRRANRVSLAI